MKKIDFLCCRVWTIIWTIIWKKIDMILGEIEFQKPTGCCLVVCWFSEEEQSHKMKHEYGHPNWTEFLWNRCEPIPNRTCETSQSAAVRYDRGRRLVVCTYHFFGCPCKTGICIHRATQPQQSLEDMWFDP